MKIAFRTPRLKHVLTPIALGALLTLGGCFGSDSNDAPVDTTTALQNKVQNIVVIYAENRAFDNLYGNFPGANGLSTVVDATGKVTAAYIAQKDRNGTVLATLPPVWGGVTAPGSTVNVTQAQSAGLANAPFNVGTAFQASANATIDGSVITRDLYHRFFENQMQINGGKNDMFAAFADSGGLVMGYFDYSASPLYKLAQQFTLADNFFQGAFGGSFLNHQYLICACAPEYPNADTAAAKPTIQVLDKNADGSYTSNLTLAGTSKASALDGAPTFAGSGNITPANYFGDNKFYAVNTMQPAFQPSGNGPADLNGNDALYADASKSTTLPVQTQQNIGDLLTAKSVNWAWYGGSWNNASKDGQQVATAKRTVIYAGNANGVAAADAVDFQPHHQPFNYYANMDPVTHASDRAAHLKDYDDLVKDAAAGRLPAVTFYKPEGLYNQHPGYTNIANADQKIADLVAKLQASPQWKNMVIVVTYDENGGQWDHVAPPKGDKVGPGTRIPALVISPFSKMGTVDHTQYDTASVLRLITRRFGLTTLPGLQKRDDALKAAGGQPMGDLTNALNLQ
ncbi:MAG: acid phosphatase [Mitsuaria chitosanitabida]|uniref:acid phosphatase n=1 Tax=Roseateles chitosanitabidus TaxID=65048 RepID=UPI001B1C30B9|nr:acid phosphatase [Roseateles chitosanitabidus]MBO9685322.1 acid phosphatase [Roseateles chitosanitabidus]